jgi:hypothetical protein
MIVWSITGVKSYVGETGKSMKAMELMELGGSWRLSRKIVVDKITITLTTGLPDHPGVRPLAALLWDCAQRVFATQAPTGIGPVLFLSNFLSTAAACLLGFHRCRLSNSPSVPQLRAATTGKRRVETLPERRIKSPKGAGLRDCVFQACRENVTGSPYLQGDRS